VVEVYGVICLEKFKKLALNNKQLAKLDESWQIKRTFWLKSGSINNR